MLISDMWWTKEYRILLLVIVQCPSKYAVVLAERLTSSDLNGRHSWPSARQVATRLQLAKIDIPATSSDFDRN
jgi:hypothetical protein